MLINRTNLSELPVHDHRFHLDHDCQETSLDLLVSLL
jgi:hypothetical protein